MRVVCIGECMVEFARRDDGLWVQGFAGDTLNVAWAMRALMPGGAGVDYLTRVGMDPLSEAMVAMLRGAGIGTAHVGRDPERGIGLYTTQTDAQGERSFAYWRDMSAARRLAAEGGALEAAMTGADLVYLSGITLAILPPQDRARLLAHLGERGKRGWRVAFDPNIRPRLWEDMQTARAVIMQAAGRADILLPTHEDEAAAFGDGGAGETLRRYAGAGVPEVVVKDGVRPTHWCCGPAQGLCPVLPAARVIDTTGAGDGFNGGYLAARLGGQGAEAAVGQAQRVAARVVAVRGALVPMADLAVQG